LPPRPGRGGGEKKLKKRKRGGEEKTNLLPRGPFPDSPESRAAAGEKKEKEKKRKKKKGNVRRKGGEKEGECSRFPTVSSILSSWPSTQANEKEGGEPWGEKRGKSRSSPP